MKIIISHCDLDGIGINILAEYYKFPYDKLYNTDYSEIDNGFFDYKEKLKDCTELIFIDFSPCNKGLQDFIEAKNISCIILDHHETGKDVMDKWAYSNKKFTYGGSEKSGTLLFYECLIGQGNKETSIVREFSELVNIYDNWHLDSPRREMSENLNRLFYKTLDYNNPDIKYEPFIKAIISKFNNLETFDFNTLEKIRIKEVIAKETLAFQNVLKGKLITRQDTKGRFFCIFQCNTKISIVAQKMLEKYKKLDYVIILNDYNKDLPKISLRSRKGINLLEYEGVSGHPESAGLENSSYDTWDDLKSGKLYSLQEKKT